MNHARPNRPCLDDMLRLPVDEVLALPADHLALLQKQTDGEDWTPARSDLAGDLVAVADTGAACFAALGAALVQEPR